MSVIGIDIGNENCYIAVARAGGIETVANEYSQRATPTYVAFGEKTRDLGVSAKNKQITNVNNTIFGFKRLIGKKLKDPFVQSELEYLPFGVVELPNGDCGVQVMYLGEKTVFTVQQVMGMMLTKLKEIAENALRIKVQDCVISVPVYFTDVERRALLNAAEIAGLNPLRLMNETTAVALSYGFYQQDIPEDKPRNVVFLDLGNSILQITACAFTKGKLKVLASVWDSNLGGRNFDIVLVRHFMEDFASRYKLDVASNKRAVVRLMQECEKLKKQMSANSLELPLNIECLMNDKDVTGRMKREVFEELAATILTSIENTMRRLLQEANLKPDDIDSVQIVGGSSRLPAVKQLVQNIFGKEPSTTLNQDEAVARGCALQCAMQSPTFKVREFSIADVQPYPIKITWRANKDEENEMEVFPKFHSVPFSRILTFFRMEPFTLEGRYVSQHNSFGNPSLGTFTIQNVTPTPEGESTKVKVKARVNPHGIFSITSASMQEKHIVPVVSESKENESKDKSSNGQEAGEEKQNPPAEEAMDADNSNKSSPNGEANNIDDGDKAEEKQEEEAKNGETKKTKTVIKSVDLPINAIVHQLSKHELDGYIEQEAKMIMQDKLEKEKADAKNAVEEYVYEMRGKLYEEYEKFVTDREREDFKQLLEDTENWLYDEGEDQQKSVYANKLSELKSIGNQIVTRYTEHQQRPHAINEFGRSIQLVHKALESYNAKEEQYSHIDEKDMKKVKEVWEEKEKWLGQHINALSKLQPHEDPPITVSTIRKEKDNFENTLRPILSKPKPKVEPPPAENSTAAGDGPAAQNDSEMQDAGTTDSDPKKPQEQQTQDRPVSNSQPEQMETN